MLTFGVNIKNESQFVANVDILSIWSSVFRKSFILASKSL